MNWQTVSELAELYQVPRAALGWGRCAVNVLRVDECLLAHSLVLPLGEETWAALHLCDTMDSSLVFLATVLGVLGSECGIVSLQMAYL